MGIVTSIVVLLLVTIMISVYHYYVIVPMQDRYNEVVNQFTYLIKQLQTTVKKHNDLLFP